MSNYTGLEIAVIGIAGRFPGAATVDAFWDNLCQGRESITTFSDEELLGNGETPANLADPRYVKAGGVLNDKEYFDSSFFQYRPDEAKVMDPQMRLFHECVYEAMENAGCTGDGQKKTGLFVGAYTNINWSVYSELGNQQGLVDGFTAAQLYNARFIATRTAYALNLRGPAITLDTACSSSLVAIDQACKSLLLRDCSIAIAGGITVSSRPDRGYLYAEGMTFSRDGHCRTFDEKANGAVGGEGMAVVVLKTLKEALKDGDHIWAIIKGSGINNDGSNKVGYTAPSVDGQAEAIMMAQKWAKVEAQSIGLIEAHGTATELGDVIEVEALNRVFGRSEKKYCALGSVKTNVGHLDSAAGAAGFIKAVLALKHRQIPPSLNFNSPNPRIQFDDSPFYVNTALKNWSNDHFPLRAGVSSFGIGGTNVHFVLEEAPVPAPASPGREQKLLLLSAKSATALAGNVDRLRRYLEKNNDVQLADVAYTLQRGRAVFPHRLSLVAETREEALTLLSAQAGKKPATQPPPGHIKTVFLFPGQGSQYVNMCRGLYDAEPIFRAETDRCFDYIRKITNRDLRAVVYPDMENGSANLINRTEYAQPLLFIIEYALARLLMSWGIKPDVLMGHSFGEYVAACIAGVFSLEEALRLISERGRLMQQADRGKMLGVSLSKELLDTYLPLHPDISLATANSQELYVVSGSDAAICAFRNRMEQEGHPCRILPDAFGFHSDQMEGILEPFRKTLSGFSFNKPTLPIISNLTGAPADENSLSGPEYWVSHLRHTVRFADGVDHLLQDPQCLFIEVGPGVELSIFVRSNIHRGAGHKVVSLVRHPNTEGSDVFHLLTAMGRLWVLGKHPDWEMFFKDESRRKLPLPSYCFDRIAYPARADAHQLIGAVAATPGIKKLRDRRKWFYTPSWRMATPLIGIKQTDRTETRTLVMATVPVYHQLLDHPDLYSGIIRVVAGVRFARKSTASYELDPCRAEDYELLFSHLAQDGMLPDRIIHGWAVTGETPTGYSIPGADLFFYSLVDMVKAWTRQSSLSDKELILLSSDLYPILDQPRTDLMKGLSPGLLKVLAREYQGLKVRHIDMDSTDESSFLVSQLSQEIYSGETDKTISLRHGKRWERTYERIGDLPASSFKTGGIYLITGGLGNFGYTVSHYLIKEKGARLLLLGRTPEGEEGEKMDRLRELRAMGEVIYHTGDAADSEKLSLAIAAAEERWGALNGVIHAAGVVSGASINAITELTRSDFEVQFAAKMAGLQSLTQVLGERRLDFCWLISSLSPILGGMGMGAYSAANSYMDHFIPDAHARGELQGWTSVSIDGIDFESKGTNGLAKNEIVWVLEQTLSMTQLPRVIVSATDLYMRLEKASESVAVKTDDWVPVDMMPFEGDLQAASGITQELVRLWEQFFGKTGFDADTDFFETGGDSLKALTLNERINRRFGVNLAIVDFFRKSSIGAMSDYIFHLKETVSATTAYSKISPTAKRPYYRLSSAQRRLYFLFEYDRESLAYVMPMVIKLQGGIDQKKLELVFTRLVQRHECFRTSFHIVDGLPVQIVNEPMPVFMQCIAAEGREINGLIDSLVQPFDLAHTPLLRAALIECGEEEHILVVTMPHMVTDGVSGALLLRDFETFYNNEQPPAQRLQYTDFSEWQQSESHQQEILQQKEFWMEEFADLPEPLDLPADFRRPSTRHFEGDAINFTIDRKTADQLHMLAREYGASLYMVLLSVLNVFLARMTGKDDIVVGTVTSGRPHADLEEIMGMFVNTLVLRNRVDGEMTFADLLLRVKDKVLKALDNQAYQYEDLLDDLRLERNASRNPLFDVMYSYESFGAAVVNIPNLDWQPYPYQQRVAKFDLALMVNEDANGLHCRWEYALSLFKPETVSRMADCFLLIAAQVAENAALRLAAIDLLPSAEKEKIRLFNETITAFDDKKTMIDLFEEQVARTPAATAVYAGGQSFTYAWLNEKSNQLAHLLRDKGVGRETSVLVLMDRNIDLIASLFGILKAGGKYIPVEPYLPDNRITEIAGSVEALLILTHHGYVERGSRMLEEIPTVNALISLDMAGQKGWTAREYNRAGVIAVDPGIWPGTNPSKCNDSEDLAYVIFTSGSTGRPKGVAVQHRPAVNLFGWVNETYVVGASDKLLFVSSVSFDLSVYDIFGMLAAGGSIRVACREELEEPDTLAKIIVEEGITFWDSAPAMLQQVLPFLGNRRVQARAQGILRICFLSGDWIPLSMPGQMKELFPELRFIGLGGATEATVWSNFYEVKEVDNEWNSIPYGKPIRNARYLILDRYRNLCPIGVTGDLYIGGRCLAAGYFNDRELTERKFIPSPYHPGEMLYDTGDMARWFSDGNIEFLGRKDSQVKIRGYRIELGEIESALSQVEDIGQVVIQVIAKDKYDKFICAYYTGEAIFPEEQLKAFLSGRLPAYMLPKYFVHLDKIPMTKNGKMDRNAFPVPDLQKSETPLQKPVSSTERALTEIWSKLLGIDAGDIGIQQDFFELGGQSIIAVHLINAIQSRFSVSVRLRDIFSYPTIEKLSRLIIPSLQQAKRPIPRAEKREIYRSSAAQERLYFEQLLNKESIVYNISGAFILPEEMDEEKIGTALRMLVVRHESLRTGFVLLDSGVMQRVYPGDHFNVERLSTHPFERVEEAFALFVRPFDLSSENLFRAALALLQDGRRLLLIDMHHAIADGISLNILLEDLARFYRDQEPAPLSLRYTDYAEWQRTSRGAIQSQREYWRRQLAGERQTLNLPTLVDRESVDIHSAQTYSLEIEGLPWRQAKTQMADHRVSELMFFLAVYYILLSKVSGATDILVGTDAVGRNRPDTETVVGTFINVLPLRVQIDAAASFGEWLQIVRTAVLDAYDNQDYPYDQMLLLLEERSSTGQDRLLDVHFSYANYLDRKTANEGLPLAAYRIREQLTTPYELKVEMTGRPDGIELIFVYSTELYDRETVECLAGYYQNILHAVLRDPGIRIGEIAIEQIEGQLLSN